MLRVNRSSKRRLVGRTLIDLVSEHLKLVHRGTRTCTTSLLLINALCERPGARGRRREEERLAVVTGRDNTVFVDENAVAHGELAQLQRGDVVSAPTSSFDKGDGGVVAHVAEAVPRGRERDGLDPATAVKLGKDVAKHLARAPVGGCRLLVDLADHGVDNTGLVVSRGSGQELAVGVPGDLDNGGAVLLDVLGNPPVVVLLEVAHGDNLGARGHSKLLFVGRPLDIGGSAVDTKNHKLGLPGAVLLKVPHVGVTILRAGHDAVGLGRPVDAGHDRVVLGEGVLDGPCVAFLAHDEDLVVVGADGNTGLVAIPRMAGDALAVSKVLDAHFFLYKKRDLSLFSLLFLLFFLK